MKNRIDIVGAVYEIILNGVEVRYLARTVSVDYSHGLSIEYWRSTSRGEKDSLGSLPESVYETWETVLKTETDWLEACLRGQYVPD